MTDNRPLSPHMSVYRPQLTSMLSIMHRGTGIVLSLTALLFVYWLAALATGAERFAKADALFQNPAVQFLLLGAMFSFFFHICNGIRHLFWDAGKGLEISQTYRSGWITLFAALLLTAGLFVYAAWGVGL